MGAGDGPSMSIRGVKCPHRVSDADPEAFIDGGGGQIAEREAALAAAVAAQLRMGTPNLGSQMGTPNLGSGEVLHQLADQEAALAAQLKAFADSGGGDGAMHAAGAMQGAAGNLVGARDISGSEDFRLPDGASAAHIAAARAAAQGRNGRQASDGSAASDARRKQRAGSGDSSDARAGGGSGGGSGNDSGGSDGGDSNRRASNPGEGQQQQSRGALSPLDHTHASPLAAPIAERPPLVVDQVGVDAADSTVLGFLASPPILEGEVADGWRQGGVDFEDWAATVIDGGGGVGTETKEPGTLGKNARTASMNRVASLEHMAKRAQAAAGPSA